MFIFLCVLARASVNVSNPSDSNVQMDVWIDVSSETHMYDDWSGYYDNVSGPDLQLVILYPGDSLVLDDSDVSYSPWIWVARDLIGDVWVNVYETGRTETYDVMTIVEEPLQH